MKKGLSVAVLNINVENKGVRRRSILAYSIASNLKHLDDDTDYEIGDVDNMDEVTTAPKDKDFFIKFVAEEMRCLALIAHAHMKPELEKFVKNNKNILRKFRLTGNHTTMKILNKVYGDDPLVRYGPTCQSGALGGDAQLVSLMCLEELGGIVFLQDPMESHMHQVDIDCLNRQVCVHDIYLAVGNQFSHPDISNKLLSKEDDQTKILSSPIKFSTGFILIYEVIYEKHTQFILHVRISSNEYLYSSMIISFYIYSYKNILLVTCICYIPRTTSA